MAEVRRYLGRFFGAQATARVRPGLYVDVILPRRDDILTRLAAKEIDVLQEEGYCVVIRNVTKEEVVLVEERAHFVVARNVNTPDVMTKIQSL